jgi:diguanylate cyclase (GGDEF)-like protein
VHTRRAFATRLRNQLPKGGSLPADEWKRRHAGILILLAANIVGVPVYSALGGRVGLVHALEEGFALAFFCLLANTPQLSRKLQAACASLGLLSAAAFVVHASGGIIETHFYFFVLIIVLTLYEDWTVFLVAVAFVLLHHGVLGTIEPHAVFDRPEEWANPWLWAAIHAAYVAAAGVAGVVAWRLNEGVRATMRETQRQLDAASRTDSLTSLGNRRQLMQDLDETTSAREPAVLVLLDLDGFKAYNDTFGHPAGDSLLERLGARLRDAVQADGTAYRLGGDEFCVLWREPSLSCGNAEALAAAALRDHGEGFSITAACGGVRIPAEADSTEAALRTADLRMYSNKRRTRPSSSTQSCDVLLRTLAELHPDLETHLNAVTMMAEAVADRLGLPTHAAEQVRLAAQLHDIGKIAIPEAILNKPAPLDASEWDFMRGHTIIGERILSAAPALADVAGFVRSSHERYDGDGYPDGLRGDAIPVVSRIVFVCDAFDAMTRDRPYRLALSQDDAVAELRRCAGSQFDPQIVDAFIAALGQLRAESYRDSTDGASSRDTSAGRDAVAAQDA